MNRSEMPLNLIHRQCGTALVGRMREVKTLPEDCGWPKDDALRVPYCQTCGGLVTAGDVLPDPAKFERRAR